MMINDTQNRVLVFPPMGAVVSSSQFEGARSAMTVVLSGDITTRLVLSAVLVRKMTENR